MKTFFIAKKKNEKTECRVRRKNYQFRYDMQAGGKFEYLMMFFWQGKIFKNLRVNIEIDFRGE